MVTSICLCRSETLIMEKEWEVWSKISYEVDKMFEMYNKLMNYVDS